MNDIRFLRQFCLSVVTAFCVALFIGLGPSFAEEMRTTERQYEGPPVDRVFRQTPIYPWDYKAALQQIDAQIERLKGQGLPEDILELAQSEETEVSKRSGRTILSRDLRAVDMLFPTDGRQPTPEELNAGRYILLHSARDGHPYVLYNLANSIDYRPDPKMPKGFHIDLWRLAADREMLPAIVNIIAANTVPVENLDPDMAEAYLRYGFDLNAKGGGYQVTLNLLEFYRFFHPDRPTDGYFQRGLDRLESYGATAERKELEGFALLEGKPPPQDAAKGLAILAELLSERDLSFHYYVRIGYTYANGVGVPRDIDLARDVYVACLMDSAESGCALNLGSYFVRPSQNFYKPILAYALYEHAIKLAGEQNNSEVLRVAKEEMASAKADFPFFRWKSKLQEYQQLIQEGKFRDIDELQKARPFP